MAKTRLDLTDRKKTRAIIDEPASPPPPPPGTDVIETDGSVVLKVSIIEAAVPAEQPPRFMSDVKT
jgi:hypothetical protein